MANYKPMVLVSDKPSDDTGILQTKLSYRTYRREAAIRRHLSHLASLRFPFLLSALVLLR